MAAMTAEQRGAIWKLKSVNGLSKEELYSLVYQVTNKEHISQLTKSEAIQVIDRLKGTKQVNGNQATYKQQKFILGLSQDLGWNGYRLAGFVKKRFNVDMPQSDMFRWITRRKATIIIEALKAMKDRGYGDEQQERTNAQ